MKILLTTLNSKFVHTNLAIRYLRNTLKDVNCEVLLEEYTINQSIEVIVSEIFDINPDLVCFSSYIWNIEQTLEIANMLKLVNPNIKILFGGPEVSFDSKNIMLKYDFIDFIIKGEGERTIKEFVELLIEKPNYDLALVKGLIFRKSEDVIENENRELIMDLDEVPFPYNEDELNKFENKIIYYEASRGCPFNCAFCLSSTIKGVRFFPIDRVKRDLKRLLEANVKQIKFVDRTFNAKKDYSLEIMKFVKANHNGITNVHLEITAHLIDDEYIEFLKTCPEGLFQFEIGVQSTNLETIKSINRITDFEKLSQVISKIKSTKKVHQHLDLIAGLPYENYERFGISFDDVYKLQPEKIQLGFLKLLKGSKLRTEEKEHQYKYINKPVYEVFENKYMNYKEFKKLKVIDHLVDVYYNEGRFEKSLKEILQTNYKRPFDLFEALAEFWVKNDYNKISVGLEKLYEILLQFKIECDKKTDEYFINCLKYDYLRQQRNIKGNLFKLEDSSEFNMKRYELLKNDAFILQYLPQYKGIPAKKLYNFVTIEPFKYDILKEDSSYLGDDNLRVYLFDYHNNPLSFEKSEVIDVTEWM